MKPLIAWSHQGATLSISSTYLSKTGDAVKLGECFQNWHSGTVPGKLTTNTQTSREHANAGQLQYFSKPVFLVSLFKRHIISRSITNHSPLLKQCNAERGYNQVDGETQLVDHESSVFSKKHHCQGDFLSVTVANMGGNIHQSCSAWIKVIALVFHHQIH